MKNIIAVLKWITIGVACCLVVIVGYRAMNRDATNARVAEEIRQNPNSELAGRTMLITLTDGRVYPVNYLHEARLVFIGVDGRWWRELVGDGQPVTMLIRGESFTGHARTVLDDPAYTADVFSRLRPSVPNWLPDWLNAKLVKITLAE
jgi:hypothetical protein